MAPGAKLSNKTATQTSSLRTVLATSRVQNPSLCTQKNINDSFYPGQFGGGCEHARCAYRLFKQERLYRALSMLREIRAKYKTITEGIGRNKKIQEKNKLLYYFLANVASCGIHAFGKLFYPSLVSGNLVSFDMGWLCLFIRSVRVLPSVFYVPPFLQINTDNVIRPVMANRRTNLHQRSITSHPSCHHTQTVSYRS